MLDSVDGLLLPGRPSHIDPNPYEAGPSAIGHFHSPVGYTTAVPFNAPARARGVPARYVRGYLMLKDRVEQDAGHAWAEAMVEGLGWVGFDISNGISPDPHYVRVATGRDYRDAAPVTGIRYGAHDETLHVKLAVAQQRVEQ